MCGRVRRRHEDRLLVKRAPLGFCGYATVSKHENPIGHCHYFLSVVADQDDGDPLRRKVRNDAVDFRFGPHVDPASGLVQDDDPRLRDEPLRKQHFLLVASRKGACDLFNPSRNDLDLFCEILGKLCLLSPID